MESSEGKALKDLYDFMVAQGVANPFDVAVLVAKDYQSKALAWKEIAMFAYSKGKTREQAEQIADQLVAQK